MFKYILYFLALLVLPLNAGITKAPFTTLSLDEVKQGSSRTGILNLDLIMHLQVGEKVQLYTNTGESFTCLVKEYIVLEKEEQVRIYGDLLNKDNGSFGFGFSKKGEVAGAIVLRNEKKTYTAKFNSACKGFLLSEDLVYSNLF